MTTPSFPKHWIAGAFLTLFLLPNGSAAPAAAPDLLAHWTFDKKADSSVGGWFGYLIGQAHSGYTGALIGSGCYFRDWASGHLETNFTAPSGSRARAVSLWFKTNPDFRTPQTLFGWGGTSPSKRYDFLIDAGNLRIEIKGTGKTMHLTKRIDDGKWHHALLSFSGGDFGNHILYVDGKQAGTTSDVRATVNTSESTKLRIGTGVQRHTGNNHTGRDFDGRIDDFGVFNRALPATDAALIHGLGRLGLNISSLQKARDLWTGPDGGTAEIGGTTWKKTSDLTGKLGDHGGTIANNDAYIVLSNNGGGIAIDAKAHGPNFHP